MKTILLLLAAVALAAAADDGKKSERIRDTGDAEYDANLKFNWAGDGSIKSKIDAMFKPIQDVLKAFGFNGDLYSESNAKGGGDVTGNFRFGGKRNAVPNISIQQVTPNLSGSRSGSRNYVADTSVPSIPSGSGSRPSSGRSSLQIPEISIPQLETLPGVSVSGLRQSSGRGTLQIPELSIPQSETIPSVSGLRPSSGRSSLQLPEHYIPQSETIPATSGARSGRSSVAVPEYSIPQSETIPGLKSGRSAIPYSG